MIWQAFCWYSIRSSMVRFWWFVICFEAESLKFSLFSNVMTLPVQKINSTMNIYLYRSALWSTKFYPTQLPTCYFWQTGIGDHSKSSMSQLQNKKKQHQNRMTDKRERVNSKSTKKLAESCQNSTSNFFSNSFEKCRHLAKISISCNFFVSRWILPGVGLRSSTRILFRFLFLVFQCYHAVAYLLQSLPNGISLFVNLFRYFFIIIEAEISLFRVILSLLVILDSIDPNNRGCYRNSDLGGHDC